MTAAIGDIITPVWHVSPSENLIDLINRLGDGILAGPDRAPDDVDEDAIFATTFRNALADFAHDAGLPPGQPLAQSIGTPFANHVDSLWNERLIFESCHDELRIVEARTVDHGPLGVVALRRRAGGYGCRIVGLCTGMTLAVEREAQGLGIGKALVMARLIVDERLPTWDLDIPAYSPRGAMTVCSAAAALLEFLPDITSVPDTPG